MKFQIHPAAFGVSEQFSSDSQFQHSQRTSDFISKQNLVRFSLNCCFLFMNFALWFLIISLF